MSQYVRQSGGRTLAGFAGGKSWSVAYECPRRGIHMVETRTLEMRLRVPTRHKRLRQDATTPTTAMAAAPTLATRLPAPQSSLPPLELLAQGEGPERRLGFQRPSRRD